jgi:prevent-host-death family protein
VSEVSIRELRNHGGEVIERVERGEHLTVTRDGRRVAELRPVQRPGALARVLVERWSRLPQLDTNQFRKDIDQVIDGQL